MIINTQRLLITLFTIHNYLTFAASYIADATREARAVATAAEAMQEEGEICSAVQIPPFCTLGPDALSLLADYQQASAKLRFSEALLLAGKYHYLPYQILGHGSWFI